MYPTSQYSVFANKEVKPCIHRLPSGFLKCLSQKPMVPIYDML